MARACERFGILPSQRLEIVDPVVAQAVDEALHARLLEIELRSAKGPTHNEQGQAYETPEDVES
jgi:hypothetical protein